MKGTLVNERNHSRLDECGVVTPEESSLLVSAKAGDSAAFENLVMPHRDSILRLAQRIVRNREDAEDVVQTAFLDALRHLESFQGRSRFSSWLKRIAMNAAFMRLRSIRHKRETSLDEMLDDSETPVRIHLTESRPNAEQECSRKEARHLLDKALRRLGPRYVEILKMRDLQGMSSKEASKILRLPVGTVKTRLHRGRVRLGRHVRSMLVPRRQTSITQRVVATPAMLRKHSSDVLVPGEA